MNDKAGMPPKFSDSNSGTNTADKPQALIGSKIRIKGELYGEEAIEFPRDQSLTREVSL